MRLLFMRFLQISGALKNTIIDAVAAVVGAGIGVADSFIIYSNQKQSTIEATEQATVEKLSNINDVVYSHLLQLPPKHDIGFSF